METKRLTLSKQNLEDWLDPNGDLSPEDLEHLSDSYCDALADELGVGWEVELSSNALQDLFNGRPLRFAEQEDAEAIDDAMVELVEFKWW